MASIFTIEKILDNLDHVFENDLEKVVSWLSTPNRDFNNKMPLWYMLNFDRHEKSEAPVDLLEDYTDELWEAKKKQMACA